MMLALALLAAAPALSPPAQTPVDLFKSACTAGTVSLARGTAAPADYDRVPAGGREALGQTLAAPGAPGSPGSPKRSDISNPIYEVGPGQALFLLAPSPAPGATGPFAGACAIIWKGEHFAAARAAILPDPPAMLSGQSPESNTAGQAFVGTVTGDLYLSATTLRGWTVLKAVPKAQAPLPGER